MAQMKIKIPIPEGIDREDRLSIADGVLEFIREQTDKGRNKDGGKFPGYSQAYRESLDFELAGKNKNKVNLKQTGDMMTALDLLEDNRKEIWIGYNEGDEENDKAEGHITGANHLPKRNFLGITKNELAKIIAENSDLTTYKAYQFVKANYDNKQSDKF